MAKFKVGDRIKYGEAKRTEGTVVSPERFENATGFSLGKGQVGAKWDSDGKVWWMMEKDCVLIKGKRSRPAKSKTVKFIAIYDEEDGDPHKKFTSKKEVLEWYKEAQEDEDIIFDSIEVYPVGKPMKVEVSFRLKEK